MPLPDLLSKLVHADNIALLHYHDRRELDHAYIVSYVRAGERPHAMEESYMGRETLD